MGTFYSILMLVAPIAGFLYLIYRHNFQGRRSLSLKDKLRGMAPFIGLFVLMPIVLFAVYLIFDIDPCTFPRKGCLSE